MVMNLSSPQALAPMTMIKQYRKWMDGSQNIVSFPVVVPKWKLWNSCNLVLKVEMMTYNEAVYRAFMKVHLKSIYCKKHLAVTFF